MGPLPPGVFQAADMERVWSQLPQHLAVLQELIAREPLFHRAEFRDVRRDFERMTAHRVAGGRCLGPTV